MPTGPIRKKRKKPKVKGFMESLPRTKRTEDNAIRVKPGRPFRRKKKART